MQLPLLFCLQPCSLRIGRCLHERNVLLGCIQICAAAGDATLQTLQFLDGGGEVRDPHIANLARHAILRQNPALAALLAQTQIEEVGVDAAHDAVLELLDGGFIVRRRHAQSLGNLCVRDGVLPTRASRLHRGHDRQLLELGDLRIRQPHVLCGIGLILEEGSVGEQIQRLQQGISIRQSTVRLCQRGSHDRLDLIEAMVDVCIREGLHQDRTQRRSG
mmetsp:Transcript_8120/g.22008  ORF Transcript_8120/g.22008 Transcript_8120/m.22008 type:complete len:218 (-) Transcript_8120:240-893(-)